METFVEYASSILANPETGITGSEIIKFFICYSVKFNKNLKYYKYPFKQSEKGINVNKRTAFLENLNCFSNEEKFFIIDEICQDKKFLDNEEVKKLRILLHNDYKEYNTLQVEDEILDLNIVEKTKHWLDLYPEVKKIYEGGINKYSLKIYERNILDDMRLSLELLLRKILNNNKNLERQREDICRWLDSRETSSYFRNMFWSLIGYYAEYQNNNIKHNDKVNKQEIEFIIEMTSLFMKNIVKFKDSEEIG